MGIIIDNLDELDVSLVRQNEELLAAAMQEVMPSINPRQGVLRDFLAYPGAVLATKNQTEARRLRQSQSLLAVQQDPSLADDDTVAAIASNYRVFRKPGKQAVGTVTIVVSEEAPLTIATGTTFSVRGLSFATTQAYTARTSSQDLVSDTDRELVSLGDGTFAFQVDVVAADSGGDGNILKDTLFLTSPPPINYVKAMATEDFADGENAETNDELISRFVFGAAAKAFSGRENMSAALRNEEAFASVVSDSIVGMGDQEMLRDKHSIFPGATGGRVDWYARTAPLYRRYGELREAVLVTKTADGLGIWQMSFTRDEYPGLYDVHIRPKTGDFVGHFELAEDIRGVDITPFAADEVVPDVLNGLEAAFSCFQTVVVRFKDPFTECVSLTPGVSTTTYAVTIRAMPNIAEMQQYAMRRSVRNTMGDALVKAPVPCFLSLGFTINLRPGQATPDTDAIAISLANLVNHYGFSGRLPASILTDTIHNHVQHGVGLSAIDMFGKIQKPSGKIRYLRNSELLVVPDEPAEMSTRRTVAFYLDPADVAIGVVTADTLPV